MTDDKVLTVAELEPDEELKNLLRLGYLEVVGLGADGEVRYRITGKGMRRAEAMVARKEPPKP